MVKKTVNYIDYNGTERTEDCYFNFTEVEFIEMSTGVTGDFSEMIYAIMGTKDKPTMIKLMKDLLLKAYGEKSPDGRRFIKSEELSLSFSQTEAFNKLYMELATDDIAASDFINALIPSNIQKMVSDHRQKAKVLSIDGGAENA